MKKTPVVCVPGFNTTRATNATAYDHLANVFDSVGFDAHFPDLDWQTLDPHHWAQCMAEYAAELIEEKNEKPVLFGFSAGAVVATLATARLERQTKNIAGLASCSLSPWFGAEQVERTLQTPNTALSKQPLALIDACRELELPRIDSPMQLYIGGQEHPLLKDAHEAAREQWPQAESIVVPECRHNVLDPAYLDVLQANLGRLAVG